jgi:alanine dehydrogenase
VIVLCDAADGSPLAIMDSIEITTLRTGAATAVAAKYLARPGDAVVAICGCGNQGRVQLRAVSRVRPVTRAYAWDTVAETAHRFAREMEGELGVPVVPIEEPRSATPDANLWVTCTTSRRAFLGLEQVAPGCFIAAVGADSEDKQELDVDLLAASAIVADILEQCATIGDLHHAIAANRLRREDVRAELGEVVAGTKPGRRSEEEIIVFDSTGTAIQDVAAAAVVYERELERCAGVQVSLGAF